MKTLCLVAVLLVSASVALARQVGIPNGELPDHIPVAAGELTLVADYPDKIGDAIRCYLINDSPDTVEIAHQDDLSFLKLEALIDGEWKRAQSHCFSGCGNSYLPLWQLKPGHFLALDGYRPESGGIQAIRYALYMQNFELASNAGFGLAAAADITLSSCDRLATSQAVKAGDFERLKQLALIDPPPNEWWDDRCSGRYMVDPSPWSALRELASGRFDVQATRVVLFQAVERHPELSDFVAGLLEQLEARTSSYESTIESTIRALREQR